MIDHLELGNVVLQPSVKVTPTPQDEGCVLDTHTETQEQDDPETELHVGEEFKRSAGGRLL